MSEEVNGQFDLFVISIDQITLKSLNNEQLDVLFVKLQYSMQFAFWMVSDRTRCYKLSVLNDLTGHTNIDKKGS